MVQNRDGDDGSDAACHDIIYIVGRPYERNDAAILPWVMIGHAHDNTPLTKGRYRDELRSSYGLGADHAGNQQIDITILVSYEI